MLKLKSDPKIQNRSFNECTKKNDYYNAAQVISFIFNYVSLIQIFISEMFFFGYGFIVMGGGGINAYNTFSNSQLLFTMSIFPHQANPVLTTYFVSL